MCVCGVVCVCVCGVCVCGCVVCVCVCVGGVVYVCILKNTFSQKFCRFLYSLLNAAAVPSVFVPLFDAA